MAGRKGMNNEEAKDIYYRAVESLKQQQYEQALELFDTLDQARPNSKHVLSQRALCLINLGRFGDAEACCTKLDGKLGAQELQDLRDQLARAQNAPATGESAGAMAAASSPESIPEAEAEQSAGNVLAIESVYPVSTDECTVTGHVKSGLFREGDSVMIVTPDGMPVLAPILRIGTAETPLKIVREGQAAVFLLRVEPHHVVPGTSVTSTEQEAAYAETMVADVDDHSREESTDSEMSSDLFSVEKLVKNAQFEDAIKSLNSYLQHESASVPAYRLLAQVYLEANNPLKDPKKALDSSRKAFELGGSNDPAVVNLLAQALAMNGEAENGLRFLERLYKGLTDFSARSALANRIYGFRNEHGLGHVWEFCDAYGDVVFETGDMGEVKKAIDRKTITLDAKCRRDHTGDWRPIKDVLSPDHPEIAALYQKPASSNKAWIIVIVILIVVIIAALLLF
jgi:tetratricopeptide (TPR) repeat protein